MAIQSKRALELDSLEAKLASRKRHRLLNWLFNDGDVFDPIMALNERRIQLHMELVESTRCLVPREQHRKLDTNSRMEAFLKEEVEGEAKPFFNQEEFRNECGMSRQSFWELHNLICCVCSCWGPS